MLVHPAPFSALKNWQRSDHWAYIVEKAADRSTCPIFLVMKKIAALTNIPRNDDLKITDRAHALMQKVRQHLPKAILFGIR